jgi:class 3 adenylate cyclase
MEVERKSGINCNYCDSAIANFNDTSLARKHPELVFLAYRKVILCHWNTKDYLGKLPFNHQFELLARQVNNDTLLAWSYLWEGSTLYNIGNKQIAYPLFEKALPIFERMNINLGRYMTVGFLQTYSADAGDYEKQIAFIRTRIAQPLNKHGYCENIFALSDVFSDYGNPDSALHYALKYLEESKANEHPVDSVAVLLAATRHSYALTKNITEASAYLNAAKQLLESGNHHAKADYYITMAKLSLNFGNLNEAHKYLRYADSLVLSDADSVSVLPELYKTYVQLYQLRNDIEAINRYNLFYERSAAALQKHLDIEDEKVIMQVYEYGRKELENAQIEQQKVFAAAEELKTQQRQKYLLLAGAFVLLLIAFLIFKNYKNQKAAREKSDALLLNILPYEVAEELKEKGYADAKHFDEVTVLFSDFKGFTTLSEKLSAQELVKEINDCFKTFDRIMEKYGIEKIKTIGDAYMAAGGLPVANKTNAADVIKAAIEMRDYMLNRPAIKLADGSEERLGIRIGINSGPVVAGIVGVKKFAYDIWGDTVNTAARMEQNGEANKINVSEATYELVKDKFITEYRGEIEAKGKGKVKMYFLERIDPRKVWVELF